MGVGGRRTIFAGKVCETVSSPKTENQMDKKVKSQMDTGSMQGTYKHHYPCDASMFLTQYSLGRNLGWYPQQQTKEFHKIPSTLHPLDHPERAPL